MQRTPLPGACSQDARLAWASEHAGQQREPVGDGPALPGNGTWAGNSESPHWPLLVTASFPIGQGAFRICNVKPKGLESYHPALGLGPPEGSCRGCRPRVGPWLSAAPDAPLAGHPGANTRGYQAPMATALVPTLRNQARGGVPCPVPPSPGPRPHQPMAQTASSGSSLQTTTAPKRRLGGSCKHTPGTRGSPLVPGAPRRFESMQVPGPRCGGGCGTPAHGAVPVLRGGARFCLRSAVPLMGSLVRAGMVRCECTRVPAERTHVCVALRHTCACPPSPGTHTWMWSKRDPGLNKVKQGLQPRGAGEHEPCQGSVEGGRAGARSGHAPGGTGAPACCQPPTFLGLCGPGSLLHLLA